MSTRGGDTTITKRETKKLVGSMGLVLLVGALSFSILACSPPSGQVPDETTPPAQNEQSTPAAVEETPAITLDLANAEDYKSINLFLSNFSEIGFYNISGRTGKAYDPNDYDLEALVWFAILHDGKNKLDSWEDPPGGPITLGEYSYNQRISADRVKEVSKVFFKLDCDVSNLRGNPGSHGYHDYYYDGGFIYFLVTNGAGMPEGIALATSLENLGDNRYKVQFNVYNSETGHYDVTDKSLYGKTSEELQKLFGAGTVIPGEAIIEPLDDGTIAPFMLHSFWISSTGVLG